MTPGSRLRAPARGLVRAGVLVLLASSAACDKVPGPDAGVRVIELARDTIHLEPGVSLVDVKVRRAAGGEFDPASVEAQDGDVVRFTAADHGGHAIVFEGAALAADARAYLERTSQLRSPPLIESGSAWVITLEDAPPGEYPFRCTTHGVYGRLTVAAR